MQVVLSFKADELLTLLGTGTLGEDELEELLSITGRNREEMTHRLNREGRPSAIYNDPLVAQEIRSWVTMADRAATGNIASSSSSAPVTGGSKIKGSNTRKDSGTSMYFTSKACWRFGDVSVMVLYVHVRVHVHIHVYVTLCTQLLIHPSSDQLIYSSIDPSLNPSVHGIYSSIDPSIQPSIYPSIVSYLSSHPYIQPSFDPAIHTSFH